MLVKCKACGKEISVQSEKCPDCGQPNNSPERAIHKMKEFFGGLIVLAIIIAGLWFWLKPAEKTPEELAKIEMERAEENKQALLMIECEDLTKKQLHFPSTYDKEWGSSYVVKQSDYYSIKLNFEAKNQLGGVIPQQAVCKYDDESKTIELLRISNR